MKRSHGQRIGYLNRMAHRYFYEKFQSMGIGPGQIFLLKYMYNNDGIHQEELVTSCQIHKANVARALAKLEEEGWVQRLQDPTDRRANVLHLTDKALSFKNDFLKIFSSWTELLTKGFSQEEKDLAYDFLERMAKNVEPDYGD